MMVSRFSPFVSFLSWAVSCRFAREVAYCPLSVRTAKKMPVSRVLQ